LAPGKEAAFGVPLPAALRVILREPFRVQSEGRVQPERVSNFLRGYVEAQSVDVGAVKTIFDRAVVKGTTEPVLRIEVVKISRGTQVIVHDLSPARIPRLDPADVWKLHGFDETGTRMDPSKFE